MRHVNWNDIEEREGGYDRPVPGGYVVRIINVKDEEAKEYLRIEWDFISGPHKGSNAATFDRAGFWPITLIRSYKESALGFFKAFKTAVEASNPGYTFDDRDVQGLKGKLMGVVLGEEGYVKQTTGLHDTRLYVAAVRSVEAIQAGDYKVPEYREAKEKGAAAPTRNQGFTPLPDDDDCPF